MHQAAKTTSLRLGVSHECCRNYTSSPTLVRCQAGYYRCSSRNIPSNSCIDPWTLLHTSDYLTPRPRCTQERSRESCHDSRPAPRERTREQSLHHRSPNKTSLLRSVTRMLPKLHSIVPNSGQSDARLGNTDVAHATSCPTHALTRGPCSILPDYLTPRPRCTQERSRESCHDSRPAPRERTREQSLHHRSPNKA